jgi:glucose dehydrogenase
VLWQDRFDSGPDDEAFDVEVSGGRVIACGFATAASGNRDWIVRAYDPSSGNLIWQDRLDLGGSDAALDMGSRGDEVYVSGFGGTAGGGRDFLVRAYATRDGSLRWQDRFDLAGGDDEATSNLVVKGNVALVGGDGRNAAGGVDFLVRAYELGSAERDSGDDDRSERSER